MDVTRVRGVCEISPEEVGNEEEGAENENEGAGTETMGVGNKQKAVETCGMGKCSSIRM